MIILLNLSVQRQRGPLVQAVYTLLRGDAGGAVLPRIAAQYVGAPYWNAPGAVDHGVVVRLGALQQTGGVLQLALRNFGQCRRNVLRPRVAGAAALVSIVHYSCDSGHGVVNLAALTTQSAGAVLSPPPSGLGALTFSPPCRKPVRRRCSASS